MLQRKSFVNSQYNIVLAGDHTKKRFVAKISKDAMGGFFTSKLSCLGCKTTIEKGAICENCIDKKRTLFVERMVELNEYEKKYSDLWVQCQRCHESLHENLICHK